MAAFPTDWSVYDVDQFATYSVDEMDTDLGMNTLMKMDEKGRSTGIYKISLFGGGIMEARYPIEHILYDPPLSLKDHFIGTSFKACQAAPMQNATSAPWRDLEFLLSEKIVFLFDNQGNLADPDYLIEYLQDLRTENPKSGASLRWAVAVSGSNRIRLEMQSLPANSKLLTKANLRGDNSVSVLLGSFPINADLFSGTDPGGPVPLFFAPNREKALSTMNANPDLLRRDISLVNSQLLRMEHLSLQDAYDYLQGRARAAKGSPAFPIPQGPPPKKSRIQPGTSASTGIVPSLSKSLHTSSKIQVRPTIPNIYTGLKIFLSFIPYYTYMNMLLN
jgi:hypothetical protein